MIMNKQSFQTQLPVVSIKDKDGNVVADYTTVLGQSVTTQSRR